MYSCGTIVLKKLSYLLRHEFLASWDWIQIFLSGLGTYVHKMFYLKWPQNAFVIKIFVTQRWLLCTYLITLRRLGPIQRISVSAIFTRTKFFPLLKNKTPHSYWQIIGECEANLTLICQLKYLAMTFFLYVHKGRNCFIKSAPGWAARWSCSAPAERLARSSAPRSEWDQYYKTYIF
jgi:hypothetical protein